MPSRFNARWFNRLRISNRLSVQETLSHFFEKNLSNILPRPHSSVLRPWENECFWTHFEPVPVFSSGLGLPSDSVVLFPVPHLLLLLWLIATEVGLYWAFLGADRGRLQFRASHWLYITQCDQNQWGHLNICSLHNYPWSYQSVSILIFIDELYTTASLLNFEPLRAGMTVIHITQGHPPI